MLASIDCVLSILSPNSHCFFRSINHVPTTVITFVFLVNKKLFSLERFVREMHFLIKHENEFLSVENGFELDPVPGVGGAPPKIK